MAEQCEHDTVTRGVMGAGPFPGNFEGFAVWTCTTCADQFVPIDAVKRLEDEQDRTVDMVTAMFTATLWGLHQQAVAAGATLAINPEGLAQAVCEDSGHRIGDGGKCVRCGHSPFLGSEE